MKTEHPHPAVAKIADDLMGFMFQGTQLAAIAANKAGQSGRVDSIYVAAAGVVGGLHVLASLLGHHGDANREEVKPEDIGKLVNPISTLLAAILCQSMAPVSTLNKMEEGKGAYMDATISFGPDIMIDAIQQVERIIGRPVRGHINEAMLRSLDEYTKDSDGPMKQFMEQRRTTPGNIH